MFDEPKIIQDNQVQKKDSYKPQNIMQDGTSLKNRQFITEAKKNKIIEKIPEEPEQRILTKSKTENDFIPYNIKPKRDDYISKLDTKKENIIIKEEKPIEVMNKYYKKEIEIKKEEKPKETIIKRYGKKEVKRISNIDKTKSVENVTEKINAFQTKKEENKNIKTEPISLFNKYKQKEKDNIKEKEIEQNIVKDEIKRKSENKYKKKEEITIKEKDKKTKNLHKISRNEFKEEEPKELKNKYKFNKTEENKIISKKFEPAYNGDTNIQIIKESEKLEKKEYKPKNYLTKKESLEILTETSKEIKMPKKSYLHLSPDAKNKFKIKKEEEKEIYSSKKKDYSERNKRNLDIDKNDMIMDLSEKTRIKDNSKIKKEKKEITDINEEATKQKKLSIKQIIKEKQNHNDEIIEKQKEDSEKERIRLEKKEKERLRLEQLEQERKERLRLEQLEQERKEKERIRLEKEEKERRLKEEKERLRLEQLEQERKERLRLEQIEKERKERERLR